MKAGPPKLESFAVVDNTTGQNLELTGDAGPIEIPGYVHLFALFDRLLDPVALSSFDGGVDEGAQVTTVTVVPPLPAGVSVTYTSSYSPNGGPQFLDPPTNTVSGGLIFGPGPTLTTVAKPTFPSGSTITVALDGTKVRSKKGEAFTGDGMLVFHTLPFAAAVAVPMADPDPDAGADAGTPPVMAAMQPVTVTFTNIPGGTIATHIHVSAGGSPLTGVNIDPDPNGNATVYVVTPAAAWPANSTIQVSVDATATDALGSTISAAAAESFTTGSN